jgi:signal peptidase I
MKWTSVKSLFYRNRYFISFLLMLFILRGAIADWNPVPTGSMKPTILEGDVIFVNKLAYSLRLPFSDIELLEHDEPDRGDIVVYNSAAAEKRMVKRVIGLPGDRIALRGNRLYINGQSAEYVPAVLDELRLEDLEEGFYLEEESLMPEHTIQIKPHLSSMGTIVPVTVPEGHYFVMGDNRDNSVDSRVHGFVPEDEIVGKATGIILSANLNSNWLPRTERTFMSLYE